MARMGTLPGHTGALCRLSGSAHPANGTITRRGTHILSTDRRSNHASCCALGSSAGPILLTCRAPCTSSPRPLATSRTSPFGRCGCWGEVAVIAAEDTRRTGKLLTHYGIATRTLSYHEHNSKTRMPGFMKRLEAERGPCAGDGCRHPGRVGPGRRACRRVYSRPDSGRAGSGCQRPTGRGHRLGVSVDSADDPGISTDQAQGPNRWLADLDHIAHTVSFLRSAASNPTDARRLG